MERKEYDLVANILSNPQSTIDSLITSGLSINNTSLQDKSVYENNEEVRKQFEDQNGEFDKARFDAFYNNAKVYYNYLAQTDYNEAIKRQATFHRDNMYVEPEKRRQGPDFIETRVANPYGITQGIVTPGLYGERTKSVDELMQANKVLLNPTTAGENLENAKWGEAPNNNFIGYFDDVLVQAQYDTEGTHRDLMTGEIVKHNVGDPKTDENGNFYYEKLDGRDIYNRRVLNKMNVLTTDGSWANQFDFFDSDDLNQKSAMGSIMKNLALVGTMSIPYVGPWIAGISIATQLAGLFGTLGKMATINNNNSTFSFLEGWSKSVNRQNASTEYAQQHPWCLENMINLVGDVFGQLKEQRFIFEQVPSVFKGAGAINAVNEDARKAELVQKYRKLLNTELSTMQRNGASQVDLLKFSSVLNDRANSYALAEMDSFIKGYNKLGEIISRGYMTGITVGDTYGEAKAAGASDMDATLLTLGYAIGEYQLLKTGLGRWNLPETRLDTYRNQAIYKALYTAKQEAQKITSTGVQESKKSYVQRMLTAGRNAFDEVWSASKANGTRTLNATLTSAAAEGVEEMSEELLADFSKGCYDVVKWLRGEDTRLNTFGYDFAKQQWNPTEIRDRYLLSLIGGAVGGGITNAVTNYKMINSFNGMSYESAVQQLVYMARNGGMEQFIKDISKINIENPNLSTNFEIINNQAVFDPGTKDNNIDINFKNVVQNQVNIIQSILQAAGAVSDNQFLDAQTLGDMRFNILRKSTVAGAMIQEYNSLLTKLVKQTDDLKALATRDLDTNGDGNVNDSEEQHGELSADTKESISKRKKEINKTKKDLDDLVSGKRALEFITKSLWEVSTFLSGTFNYQTLPLFAEQKYGKKIQDITEEELNQAKEDYEQLKTTSMRDDLSTVAMTFLDLDKQFSSVVKNSVDIYRQNSEKTRQVLQLIDKLNQDLLYTDNIEEIHGRLAAKSDKLMSNQLSIFSSGLISIFGTDEQKSRLQDIARRRAEAARSITEETTQEEIEAIHHPFNIEQTELVYDTIENNIHQYAQEIINNGFATKELKSQFIGLLQDLNRIITPLSSDIEIMQRNSMNPELVINKWESILAQLNLDMQSIERLSNTPIEKNLDEFAISIGRNPIKITELIARLDTAFNEASNDITNFQILSEQELKNAIETMRLYAAAIKAARTDNANFDNLFGFNATLNEVSAKIEGVEKLKLAEIDKETADLFLEDINSNLNKLLLLSKIYALNKGQKLARQDKVAIKKDVLIYKRLRFIIQILDDIDELDKDSIRQFETTLKAQKLHSNLLDNNSTAIENQEEFQKENIAIENAVYELFQANKILLENPEVLAKLVDPKKLDLYNVGGQLLNEDMESIDDNAFVWWLASRAALKASDFYFQFKQVLNPDAEKPIAPIVTQELAIYNNYASIINGNVFTTFFKALRLSITRDWKASDPDRRKEILLKLKKAQTEADHFSDEKFSLYGLNLLTAPRYSNIVLTEGIPGSGKSFAVFNLTIQLLKKFHGNKFDNIIVAHGANPNSAEKLRNDMQLEDAQTFGRNALMKYISSNWVEYTRDEKTNIYVVPENVHTITAENEIISKLDINKNIQNPPSLIIIDEISKFTSYDLDLIDKFARHYGITVLVAGDFDQSGVVGQHKIPERHEFDNSSWEISLARTNMIHSPKLGVSMRTDNMVQTNNLIKTQLYLQNPEGVLDLDYAENEEGLFGVKLVQFSNAKNIKVEEILREIDKIAATLDKENGEKIGYIYDDDTSELYKALSRRSDIELFKDGTAQGLEGRYYIIDLNDDSDPQFLKNFYTGISRAQKASLVIIPERATIKTTERLEAPIKEPLGQQSVKRYSKRRKEILEKIATTGEISTIIPRTKDTQNTTPPSNNSALQQAIAAEKQRLLQVISQAQSEIEINQAITNSIYAQLGSDTDIITARTTRIQQLNEEAIKKQEFLQKLILDINNTNTLDELETVINNAKTVDPDILQDSTIESAYNDKKSKIELDIQQKQELQNYIQDTLIRLSNAETVQDLDLIVHKAEQKYPGIMNSNFLLQAAYDNAKKTIDLKNSKPEDLSQPIVDDKIDDESEPNNFDISDVDTYQGTLDSWNEDKNIPENSAEVKGNIIQINMLYHTFNSFETGVKEGPNGEVIPIGTPERIAKRIDSIYGLMKLFDYLGTDQSQLKLKDYTDFLGELRSRILNIEDKSELDKELKNILGLPNIYTTFALKSSFRPNNGTELDEYGYPKKSSYPFDKSVEERTLFNGSNDSNSQNINRKSIVLIIGTKETGNLLELPLLTLSSPFTILQTKSKNGQQVFKEVYDTFKDLANKQNPNWEEDLKVGRDPRLDLVSITKDLIAKYEQRYEYRNLINLFKLFLVTDNFVKYIRDLQWTPKKNLHLTGAHVVTKKGYYQLEDGLRFNDTTNPKEEWISVADFAGITNSKRGNNPNLVNPDHNPQTTVTQIFLIGKNDEIDGVKLPIKKGNPFVLVSYDKSIQGDINIIEQYVKQLKDPSVPQSVVMMYIRTPEATIEEFCKQVFDFNRNKREDISIGYFSTGFKLLKWLIEDENGNINQNSEVYKLITRKLRGIAPKLIEILQMARADASTEELKALLNQTRDWSSLQVSNKPEKLTYLIRNCIEKLVTVKPLTLQGVQERVIDDAAMAILKSEAERIGITLFHHFPMPKNSRSNKYFILPNPTNDYTLAGMPCLIHGKVDSYTYSGSMDLFIDQTVKELHQNKKGFYYHNDNTSYFKGNSNLDTPIITREDKAKQDREKAINNIIDYVSKNTNIVISPESFNNKTIQEAIIEIADTINSTPHNKVAFVINGELKITDENSVLQGNNRVIYHNGQPITDISGIIQANGQVSVQVSVDGKIFDGIINKNERVIELLEQQQSNNFNLNIDPNTINDYLNEGKILLEPLVDADPDLVDIFNSSTYDEFLQKLKDLVPLDKDEDVTDSISFRIDMLNMLVTPQTELQKKIFNDLVEIEKSKKQEICPDSIKIAF